MGQKTSYNSANVEYDSNTFEFNADGKLKLKQDFVDSLTTSNKVLIDLNNVNLNTLKTLVYAGVF